MRRQKKQMLAELPTLLIWGLILGTAGYWIGWYFGHYTTALGQIHPMGYSIVAFVVALRLLFWGLDGLTLGYGAYRCAVLLLPAAIAATGASGYMGCGHNAQGDCNPPLPQVVLKAMAVYAICFGSWYLAFAGYVFYFLARKTLDFMRT